MRRTAAALMIALALLAPTPASAHDGPHDPAAAHDAPAAEPEPVPEADAAAQIAAAKQRLERAEAAYGLMMSRNFPRGDARAKIVAEREAARSDWKRLAAEHPDLVPAQR